MRATCRLRRAATPAAPATAPTAVTPIQTAAANTGGSIKLATVTAATTGMSHAYTATAGNLDGDFSWTMSTLNLWE
ncbi:hypothetical protein [Streptomyces sp. NPDC048248]|uniref:hypothetical protein n=1 Tax=Streptomyces sp. NPDC048248 TaxID=3365523 RepID=UPI0037166863